MRPCPEPSGQLLPAHHRGFLQTLLKTFADKNYLKSDLDPLTPGLVAELAALCSGVDEFSAWMSELSLWIRWHRLQAFWLTNIFQLATMARGSFFHLASCDLYADAQSHFADDVGLSSLETAYAGYVRNRRRLGAAFDEVGESIRIKLRDYYSRYYRWSRQFDYTYCNPCSDHMYSSISQSWLVYGISTADRQFDPTDAGALREVISQAKTNDVVYYSILARRLLSYILGSERKFDLAAEQLTSALADAQRLGLDTEIGHLHRLLGLMLRKQGEVDAACIEFERAVAFEQQPSWYIYTSYWQALSARELGDTRMRQAGRRVDVGGGRPETTVVAFDDLNRLGPALQAYRVGRIMLNSHLTLLCPFPVGRAAKQQLFRSFGDNAMQAACLAQSTSDMLAEIEFSGPREATEVVTAINAAREMDSATLASFRRDRALYYRALNTMPSRFETYLENIVRADTARRAYLQQTFKITGELHDKQLSDTIVEKVLALRIPNTIFLLFHLAQERGTAVLLDLASGKGAPFPLPFGEDQIRPVEDAYRSAVATPEGRQRALDELMTRYAELLGPLLERIAPFLAGKHLKIFPRLQMNSVPLHALRIGGKHLIEHAGAISYGQTLGLFLANHAVSTTQPTLGLRVVLGNNVPWYKVSLPRIGAAYGRDLDDIRDASWDGLMKAMVARPAKDTLFACHGEYRVDDLEASQLTLSANGEDHRVAFSRIFSELDLQGCRSVIMGACESGIVRTEIGAEYVGLPSAMLSSGVQYVIGALWRIPQLATAILMECYLELVRQPLANVSGALREAQCGLMTMTRAEVAAWINRTMEPGPQRERVLAEVQRLDDRPFSHPYFWAGLQVVGDV
jgi:CHAT domain-containing protein